METPEQRCARLIGALEKLVDQEAACVQTRDFAAVIDVQRRAAPIVEELVSMGSQYADQKSRTRLDALLKRRDITTAQIGGEIEKTRRRLTELGATSRRVSQVSAYAGSVPANRRQFSGLG